MIAGFIRPDAGRISVDGRVLSTSDHVVAPEKRRMGMVFQNYAVWPHRTVFDNVAFGLQVQKRSRAEIERRVGDMLELIGLSGLERRYPGQLSGGQQQRVALARSLVVEPEILLLDEPLSNLDAKLRERMRTELKHLQRKLGITFVYVTHDQAEALALSDRVVVLYQGTLQQEGTPIEIYSRPVNRIVADFMGLVNLIPVRLTAAGAETAAGLVAGVSAPDRLTGDGGALLVVRPEDISIASGSGPEGLPGAVEEVTYLGDSMHYLVRLDGTQVRVRTHPTQQLPVGARVSLRIDGSRCTLVPA
jgi:iron(III) transport system ATP-binding protein